MVTFEANLNGHTLYLMLAQPQCNCKTNRIMNWLRLEQTLRDIQLHCHPSDQAAQGPIQPGLETVE